MVTDDLRATIRPLLPPEPKGAARASRIARAAPVGILSVLRGGIPREEFPRESGCGSGMTCWRRLCD